MHRQPVGEIKTIIKYGYWLMIKVIQVVALLIFMSSSCGNPDTPAEGDTVVVDDLLGREVSVPANVEKVVGVRAGALRMLVYMDAVSLIAGVEEPERNSDRPYMLAYPELAGLPAIGPVMGGDAEMILNVNPDVIFTTYSTVQDANELQAKTGIPVVALECRDLGTETATLFSSFELIGKITGKEKRADELMSFISDTMEDLDERTSGIPDEMRPSVYAGGLSYSTSYGIPSTHPAYAPFLFINAENVASGIDERLASHVKGTFIDTEQLMLWNPDYLFIDQSGFPLAAGEFKTKPALRRTLDASREGNIFNLLPYNDYATNYEFVLLNAWFAGKQVYPGNFEDICIEEKSQEILSFFYGKPVKPEKVVSSPVFQRFAACEKNGLIKTEESE